MIPDQDVMHTEWVAWRRLCDELEERGIHVNDAQHRMLVATITVWGECLVTLRMDQDDDTRLAAMDDAVRLLKRAVGS